MSVNYRYDSNIIVVYMTGEYSINDLRTTLLNSFADSKRPPGSFLLFDFGDTQSVHTRSTEEIQTMAEFISSMGNRYNNRLAIVSSHELPHILKRFLSAESEIRGIEANVFRAYDEAREWLLSNNLR